jgi:hypothetical protein
MKASPRRSGATLGHAARVSAHPPGRTDLSAAIDRAAAQHGGALLQKGLTVDQVVHDYGDRCQAVTELAREKQEPISVDELHTFNRCLDSAIAGAVPSLAANEIAARRGSSHGRAAAAAVAARLAARAQRPTLHWHERFCHNAIDLRHLYRNMVVGLLIRNYLAFV